MTATGKLTNGNAPPWEARTRRGSIAYIDWPRKGAGVVNEGITRVLFLDNFLP